MKIWDKLPVAAREIIESGNQPPNAITAFIRANYGVAYSDNYVNQLKSIDVKPAKVRTVLVTTDEVALEFNVNYRGIFSRTEYLSSSSSARHRTRYTWNELVEIISEAGYSIDDFDSPDSIIEAATDILEQICENLKSEASDVEVDWEHSWDTSDSDDESGDDICVENVGLSRDTLVNVIMERLGIDQD